jgi:choline dehydrogenase-like flavoprotein
MTAFLKSDSGQEMPDLQLFCTSTTPLTREWFPGWRPPGPDGFGVRGCGLRPDSRGSLQLASGNPKTPPRIFTNFLSTDNDRKALRQAVRIIREIVASPPFQKFGPTETSPGKATRTDEEIDAFVRQTVDTLHHPSGTCRLGSDEMAVVDPEFRVRGIEKLRVVDASTMPDLIGGNINAAVIMIAERAADLIQNRPLLAAIEET